MNTDTPTIRTGWRADLWRECVASALDEHGVVATPEQIAAIARDMEDSAEGISWQEGPPPPNPLARELSETKRAMERAARQSEADIDNILGAFAFSHGLLRDRLYFANGEVRVR